MTDKEKIRAEIEQVKLIIQASRAQGAFAEGYILGQESVVEHLEKFIDSMHEEPVSEDLEEAAIEICSKVLKGETITIDGYEYVVLSDAEECFKAGAKWQKEYIMKEIKIRLVDAATNQDKSTDVVEQTYYNGMVDALGRLRDKFMED